MWYQAGADLVVVVHLLFIGLLVLLVALIGYRGFLLRHRKAVRPRPLL